MAGLTLADLLELLGHDSYTSVCNKPPGGAFTSRVVASHLAPAHAAGLVGDVWFGVNPLKDIPASGRGTVADVQRLAAVYCDLDVKPSGMASFDDAAAVIDDLSDMLGSRPSAVVATGHGLQPYWPIEPDNAPSGPDAQALLRRWGRLVAHVAEIRDGEVDPVYDLARVLRVPGTYNCKDPNNPIPVVGGAQKGRPLATEELDEALVAYGAVELPGDRDTPGQRVVSDPGAWGWAEETCGYARAMIDAWDSDEPAARHPWLLAQATRIAVAHRNGCWSQRDWAVACERLTGRFRRLLQGGQQPRSEAPGEVADAFGWGKGLAAGMSDTQVAAELGNHRHEALESLAWDPTGKPPPENSSSANAYQDGDWRARFEPQIRNHADKLLIAQAGRELYNADRLAELGIPPFDAGSLAEILARPVEPPYRVEGLIPNEASTLIVAMRKTGKTTFNLNLARSLILGEPFLGRFEVRPIDGNVGLLNYEVSGRQIARWADEVGIPHDRLHIVNLRGRRNPLGNDEDKAELTEWLRDRDCESLIVDPFGRAYTGVSQNDSGEVGAWLAELDRWARGDVGVVDLALAVHAGWEGERSRGASALEDWGDTIITMTRRKTGEQQEDEDGAHRYLKAEGRDVDIDEDQLEFDKVTRLLTLTGLGGRKKTGEKLRAEKLIPDVVLFVTEHPGCSQKSIEDGIAARKVDIRRAAGMADLQGLITRKFEGKGWAHFPVEGERSSGRGKSHDVDNLVPMFQAGNAPRPDLVPPRPGRGPATSSPSSIDGGRRTRRSGPCSNPAHTPTIRGDRWQCDDCDRESGGSAS